MENQNVLNGNKLIAKFMGAKEFSISNSTKIEYCLYPCEISGETPNGFESQSVKGLLFHKSWDWLIPVVEKISKWLNDLEDETGYINFSDHYINFNEYSFIYDSFEDLYNNVIEFIKWYNNVNNKNMKKQT